MTVPINYPHTIRIIKTTVDEYASEVFEEEATVPAVFEQNTGWLHGANQSAITADAVAFVDPANAFVQENFNRLEGMLVVHDRFGSTVADSVYRITGATPSEDHQLGNTVDNVRLDLKKSTAIQGVS